MLYMTEPVLTQQIIIGFKARLEKKLTKIREYSKFVKLKVSFNLTKENYKMKT